MSELRAILHSAPPELVVRSCTLVYKHFVPPGLVGGGSWL